MNNPRRIQRHLVKALAAGALLAAAALPLAIATAAGAVTITATFTPGAAGTFGAGGSGTVCILGATFADDGSNTTVTTNAPGVTFSGAAEPLSGACNTGVTANYASTSASAGGPYSLTVTDSSGAQTFTSAFSVTAAPTVTSLSVPGAVDSTPNAPITTEVITGTGFVNGATVTLTSTVDGTKLASGAVAGDIVGGVSTAQGSATFTSATSLTVSVSSSNSITGGSATPGTYTVTVKNPDGGTVTTGALFTITGIAVGDVSPSAAPVPGAGTSNVNVTVSGSGFETGATVAVSGCGGDVSVPVTASTVTTSSTTITTTFAVAAGAAGQCTVTVTNPSVANGGNAASFALVGAFGAGVAANNAASVTATSATTALVPGAASTAITFTGVGFSQYSTAAAFVGTTANAALDVTLTNAGSNVGTTVTFNVLVASGASAGPDNVVINGSTAFPAAFSVAGPAIASQSGIVVGAKYGTVVTLTGTGFTNTTTGVVTDHGGALQGTIYYVSATTMNLVITTSPVLADSVAATAPTVVLTQNLSGTVSVSSQPFTLTVDAAPAITGAVTYKVGSDVGVGATAQTVTFHGTGFAAGATVGAFANGNGVADANVTATVTAVTSTSITATIAIKAPDANFADGYTITNTDGGTITTVAGAGWPLLIGAAPTITAVAPSPALPSATTAFTITGTGFATGAVVTTTPSNGICAAATIASSTSITVSCALGIEQLTATDLTVTNVDGGTATSATVLPAATPAPPKPAFHVSKVHGAAVSGKTVTLTITGTGFYGQPKIKSSAAGTKAVVSGDTGKALTVHVTTKAGQSGWHTFTVTLANGKSGKVNYDIKK